MNGGFLVIIHNYAHLVIASSPTLPLENQRQPSIHPSINHVMKPHQFLYLIQSAQTITSMHLQPKKKKDNERET
jgi:hypothetical protein